MNWRERVSVSIPCFGIRFSVVLYITNAPSIQMIQQLLGSPVVYQFDDMRFFVREASFPPPPPVLHNFLLVHNLLPQCTLIFWRKWCNKGGGQYRIRNIWNPYIFFQINALMDINISIIDICYANTAPIPKTLIFSLLRKAKVEKLTKKVGRGVRLIVIGPLIIFQKSLTWHPNVIFWPLTTSWERRTQVKWHEY